MTFIQPFASPEIDLEGMWLLCIYMSAIISALYLMFSSPSFSHLILSFLVNFLCILFSLFLFFPCFSASLCYTAEGSKCKSSSTVFFSRALISADDVSQRGEGDNSEATAAALPYSPHADLCLSFFSLSPPLLLSFLPHFQHYQYRLNCALRTSL